ncbi:MAG: hypothetical protein J6P16_05780 [Eubacterium sp.]|nr:hypothetical protein [Eubacterium sp.]
MNVKKRILGMGLVSAMMLGSIASAAQPQAQAAADYGLIVGGVKVRSANASDVLKDGGSVKYDAATATLTLDNAMLSDAYMFSESDGVASGSAIIGVTGKDALKTIVLKGESEINYPGGVGSGASMVPASGDAASVSGEAVSMYGILSNSDITIKGSGSFSISTPTLAAGSTEAVYLADTKTLTIKGKASVSLYSGASTEGNAVHGNVKLSGTSVFSAYKESGIALAVAPVFTKKYTPYLSAGEAPDNVEFTKKKPGRKKYTAYSYVSIKSVYKEDAELEAKRPEKEVIVSLIPNYESWGSGSCYVEWKQLSTNCTGYQYDFSQYSDFHTKIRQNASKKYVGGGVSGLTVGKTYYVRVRAYNKVDGKKIYGKWSKVKSFVAE